jgi:hypothetical protein
MGLTFFNVLYDGINIDGGLHLFSLQEIEEALNDITYIKEGCIPIAHLLEGRHLVIDQSILKNKNRNYLALVELEYEPLNLNFELFMDSYILSQGESFWEWPIYSSENY